MFPFVLQYAQEAALNAQGSVVDQLMSSSNLNIPVDDQTEALGLVLPDNLSFASAAWFLKQALVHLCKSTFLTSLHLS